jgi:hypothetical protein
MALGWWLGLGKNPPNPQNRTDPPRSAPTRSDLECFWTDSGCILSNLCGAGRVSGRHIFLLRISAPPRIDPHMHIFKKKTLDSSSRLLRFLFFSFFFSLFSHSRLSLSVLSFSFFSPLLSFLPLSLSAISLSLSLLFLHLRGPTKLVPVPKIFGC